MRTIIMDGRGGTPVASDRNVRRFVAQERVKYRQTQARERLRRPAVWAPGEHLVIDWAC